MSKSASHVRATYDLIKARSATFPVQVLCRVLEVAPSGYYAWLKQPLSNRAQKDARLLRLIRTSFVASQGIYGAPRVFLDLREAGETCSKHRVARLMRENRLHAFHGYRTRRWSVGKPAVLIPNLLQRRFTVSRPNRAWVTDITYVRTWQWVALPRRRHGSLLAEGCRLGRPSYHSPRARARRRADGRPRTTPQRDADSFPEQFEAAHKSR